MEKDEVVEQIETLKLVKLDLKGSDLQFAEDLLSFYGKHGRLTPNQEPWVGRLIERATVKKEVREEKEVGAFDKVYALFQLAGKHLQYPKITLQLKNGQVVQLYLSGQKSKFPNVINVTDGKRFGENIWYGRVTPEGHWMRNRTVLDSGEVEDLLIRLGQDPTGTAKEYGMLTGNCCFCCRPLTDEQSIAAGYGATCAKHYGLSKEYKAAKPLLEATA